MPAATRRVVFPDQGAATTAVYARSALDAETVLLGPALIEDMASTIVIPPGAAQADLWRNVIVQLQDPFQVCRSGTVIGGCDPLHLTCER